MLNVTRTKIINVDLNEEINVIGSRKSKNPIKNCKSDLLVSIIKIINAAVRIARILPIRNFFI
jgi:hypothetical protein